MSQLSTEYKEYKQTYAYYFAAIEAIDSRHSREVVRVVEAVGIHEAQRILKGAIKKHIGYMRNMRCLYGERADSLGTSAQYLRGLLYFLRKKVGTREQFNRYRESIGM